MQARVKVRTLPFGYQYDSGTIVIQPREQKTVHSICEAYLSGDSLLKISKWLNE